MSELQIAYAAWAKLDKGCRHTTEPGSVLDRLRKAERKAWERYVSLRDVN